MTLRTITFDDSTHKVVPLEPTEIQIQQGCISQTIGNFASYEEWWNAHSSGVSQRIRDLIAKYYRYMIAAAPEYCDKSLYQEQLSAIAPDPRMNEPWTKEEKQDLNVTLGKIMNWNQDTKKDE